MQFRLRTLLIVLAIGPMVLALTYSAYLEMKARQARRAASGLPFIGNGESVIFIDPQLVKLIDDSKVPAMELSVLTEIPARKPDATASPTTTTSPPVPK